MSIQFINMEEVKNYLGTDKTIKFALIKQGCKMLEIPFVGGGTTFFKSKPSLEEELECLKTLLHSELHTSYNYVIAYEKLIRPNTSYSYYSVLAIRSSDMLDLKKAFKVQKLKAFL